MWLSLHVFEDRYKKMLRDCQGQGFVFGVVLIREGDEVGPTAEPYLFGTLARVHQVSLLPNGSYLIIVQGTCRIRVLRLLDDRPYLQGAVEEVPEVSFEPEEEISRVAEGVARLFSEYLALVERLGGRTPDVGALEGEPRTLSWAVASSLLVAPSFRQELLETDDVLVRLEREKVLLEALLRVLHKHIDRSMVNRPYPFSLN